MIAVVIPTIESRKDVYDKFIEVWQPLFDEHGVTVLKVLDGEEPRLLGMTGKEIMGEYADCLSNFNAGIRNLGFAYVAKFLPEVEYIITLDDDEMPIDDPIQDHVDALDSRVAVSWLS